VTCPTDPTSLAPTESTTCTATYTVTATDVTNGSITNTASGHATYNGEAVSSEEVTRTVNATGPTPAPKLEVKKTAQEAGFAAAGDLIHYSYELTNTGNVTLTGPFSVTDNKIADPNKVTCPTDPTSLAPTESTTCTATYTVTATDVTNGSITNTASGHALVGTNTIDSDLTTLRVNAVQAKLELKKEAKQTSFIAAGNTIDYTYTLTNTGNVTLTDFSVSDDKIVDPNKVTCPTDPTSLAHGESTTCTATYTVTGADVSAGSVVNKAIAHARIGERSIDSDEQTLTVSISPLESFGGATAAPTVAATAAPTVAATAAPTVAATATPIEKVGGVVATPVRAVTLPPTSSNGSSPSNDSLPLLVILIALAFGGLGLLAAQAQRSTIRR
jgi:hypothetical protein